jgi:hypothetical protein
MRLITVLVIGLMLSVGLCNSVHGLGMVKLTIKVVDEDDKPVEGADVRLCFKGGCLKKDATKGKTDINGLFIASGYSVDGVTGGAVEKEGYYYSGYHHDFFTTTLGMYQPWNKEIKVVLRPKIKPVPMYARRKTLEPLKIPAVGRKVGFDLIKFDWVIPYGQGTVADFVFLLDSHYDNTGDNGYSNLMISFSNKFDGMQPFELDKGGDFTVGSEFRTPRYVPEKGYQDKVNTRFDPHAPDAHAYRTTDTFWFFRVRSEVDKNGNLKRAMYGKIESSLIAKPTKDGLAKIEMRLWLNPDYTRNMEFDIDRNLFSPLPDREILRIP